MTISEHRRIALGRALAAFGLLAIVFLTLRPSDATASLPFWCMRCGDRPAVDYLLNIFLFMPFALGLTLSGVRPMRALLACVGLTLAIELLQSTVIPGRFPSARDLITNTMGAAIGVQMGQHWHALVWPRARTAAALFSAAVAGWLCVQAVTVWLLAIDAPPAPWWAQIRPDHDRFPAVFMGNIHLLAQGNHRIVESDQLPDPEPFRRSVMAGEVLSAEVSGVQRDSELAPIVALAAARTEVVVLAQSGADAMYRVRLRATRAGLRTPAVRLDDAFAGDTAIVAAAYADGQFALLSTRDGGSAGRKLAASPSWAWALLVPVPNYAFGGEVHALTALWLIACTILIGFWGAQTGKMRPFVFVMIGVAAVMALLVLPRLGGLLVAHWSEWLGVAIGVLLGWTAGRFAARRATPGGEFESASNGGGGQLGHPVRGLRKLARIEGL